MKTIVKLAAIALIAAPTFAPPAPKQVRLWNQTYSLTQHQFQPAHLAHLVQAAQALLSQSAFSRLQLSHRQTEHNIFKRL